MNYYEDNGWAWEFRHHMPDTLLLVEWADKFNMENYVSIFEKTHPNTLIWQVIVVVIIIWFRKELMELVHALIKKIPELKSFGRTEFELSAKVQKDVKEKSPQLDKKLKSYENKVTKGAKHPSASPKDPSAAFFRVFVDVEILLRELNSLVFYTVNSNRMKPLRIILHELVRSEVINKRFLNDFRSAQELRNRIAHGQEILESPYRIELYSKVLLLLKDELAKCIKENKPHQVGDRLPGKRRRLGDRL